MNRKQLAAFFGVILLGQVIASDSLADNSQRQVWNPSSYPSLLQIGGELHVFDNHLNPTTPSLIEQVIFLWLVELPFCRFENIDLSEPTALRLVMLERCDRAIGTSSRYKMQRYFTRYHVDEVLGKVKFLSHYPNDKSGFSGTLVRRLDTGKAILAIRGVEPLPASQGGDLERDLMAIREIQMVGAALGQLSSASNYLERLVKDGLIGQDERITLAGEGLGAHIAFLFNELCPERVEQIVSFFGIGIPRLERSKKCPGTNSPTER